MNQAESAKQRLDKAFSNFLSLAPILLGDLDFALSSDDGTSSSRRNYIRVTATLIEGYAHCLRDLCAVGALCESPELTSKELQVIQNEGKLDTKDRIKLSLSAAYKLFELKPTPHFKSPEWQKATKAIDKRNRIMHPTSASDLNLQEEAWAEINEGIAWIIKQFFEFFDLFDQKFGS